MVEFRNQLVSQPSHEGDCLADIDLRMGLLSGFNGHENFGQIRSSACMVCCFLFSYEESFQSSPR